jgi:predicted hydrocarbon binding protein
MSEQYGFEQAWLEKLSCCLEEIAGEAIRKKVMAGSEALSEYSSRQDVIDWTKRAMERLESLVSEGKRRAVMTGCACQYPKSILQGIRKIYEETKDLDRVHRMLQEEFESFLKNSLKLDNTLVEKIIGWGWGVAGIKTGNTIIATKIPKSGYLIEYMNETDPEKKRQIYCHCPRIRDALKTSETIPPTYCYCGAGFYKGIWEEILQKPVRVEVLESVLQGDDVCKIAIHLSSDS